MTGFQDIATIILVSAGILSMLVGSLGIVRLPDFYTRTHAVSKSDALGILCVISGLIIHEGATINSLKLFFIVLFIMLSNPIGTHALARVAWMNGVRPMLGGTAGGSVPATPAGPGTEFTGGTVSSPADKGTGGSGTSVDAGKSGGPNDTGDNNPGSARDSSAGDATDNRSGDPDTDNANNPGSARGAADEGIKPGGPQP